MIRAWNYNTLNNKTKATVQDNFLHRLCLIFKK